jgi:citronellyl-CoA dehydrogenase
VLCEELVKGDSVGTAVGLLAQSEFALSALADEANDELKETWLAPAIRGELIGAIGVSEPGAGSDVASLTTRARRDGDDYVISGQKIYITNGTRADFVTLAVRTGEPGPRGISLVVFPTDTKGFQVGRRLDKLGSRASDTGELFFDECRIPASNLIGEEGRGMHYILSHFGGERLVIAAFSVGIMERLIELGIDYANERSAFGSSLLGFQTWRHRFAEMATRLEATRALTYQAARLLSDGDPAADMAVSMAKLHGADAVQAVAAEVLQLHGGYGQIEESPIPRYYRDVAAFSIGAGTSEIMREIISRSLVKAS